MITVSVGKNSRAFWQQVFVLIVRQHSFGHTLVIYVLVAVVADVTLNSRVCTTCQSGYYGPQCNQTCPSNCYGGRDINMGKGTCNVCQPGYYGTKCDKECARACSGCHQNLHSLYTDTCVWHKLQHPIQ